MTPFGYPSDAYHCLLDEQPYYLVPSRLFGSDPAGPLVVNPLCWFSWHGALPPERAQRITCAESLCPGDWVVWVDDPATRALWPYWLGPEFAGYLMDQAPGYPLTKEIPALARWVLARAHILVEPDLPEQRRMDWLQSLWIAARQFERGYVSIGGLVPPFHLGALRRYFRHQIRSGTFGFGDGQVERRYAAHNDGVARFVHHQLARAVADITRRAVIPSYAYLSAYESGAMLESHTDREQCEYSITLCIDATPEPDAQVPWPIQLDIPDGALRIWQHLGDALIYRGRHLPHSREVLPAGRTSTSLLFHYVDRSFAGSLQ